MDVMDVMYHEVRKYPGGATALAVRMGKSGSKLNHELSRQPGNKLGFEDVVTACDFMDTDAVLRAWCQHRGGTFIKLGAMASEDDMQGLGRAAKEFGEFAAEFAGSLGDGSVSMNDLSRIQREGLEAIAAIANLVTHARAVHEAGVLKSGEVAGR